VLQEGIPCDDISVVEALDHIKLGDQSWVGRPVPCVIASADKGTVRPWCEERGIKLTPTEFFPGQVDYLIDLDTERKNGAFKRKWVAGTDSSKQIASSRHRARAAAKQ
jgi:hypothetical protein